MGAFFLCVHFLVQFMTVTFDFQISGTPVPGVYKVMALNEDAFSYITDECDMATLPDGSAPISDTKVAHFIETSEQAQLCSVLV